MTADLHERARVLIALSGPEGVSHAERSWLTEHLESCASCREYAENSAAAIRLLRVNAVTAGVSLVATTQIRVRERARELQRRRERLWMIWACTAAVTLCAGFTTAVMWRAVAWIGQQAQLSTPVWELAFVVLSLMPTILAGILLLARGTHLADHNGSYQA